MQPHHPQEEHQSPHGGAARQGAPAAVLRGSRMRLQQPQVQEHREPQGNVVQLPYVSIPEHYSSAQNRTNYCLGNVISLRKHSSLQTKC